MNGRERILCALQRGVPDVVPIFEWFIDASVGKALTGSDDPLDIVERLDLDGVNVRADYGKEHLDDVTLVDEWGIKRQLTGDCLPALLGSPIQDVRNHGQYRFPDSKATDNCVSCREIGIDGASDRAASLEGKQSLVRQRVDGVGTDQRVDVQRVGIVGVLGGRRCPEWTLRSSPTSNQPIPAVATEGVQEVLVCELALSHSRLTNERR